MYGMIDMKLADGSMTQMPFMANAATPIRLKQIFQTDFWKTFGTASDVTEENVTENLDVISELAYVMHCQAEKRDMMTENFEKYVEWLETLDGMAILSNAAEIISLYIQMEHQGSSAKNPDGLPQEK